MRLKFLFRQIVIGAALAAGLSAMPHRALAQAGCTRLYDRLDAINSQLAETGQEGVADNQQELTDARAMFSRLSCGSYPYDPACQELKQRIAGLQGATRGSAPSGLVREKQRITAAINAAGCTGAIEKRQEWDNAVEGAQNPKLFEQLYREDNDERIWRDGPPPIDDDAREDEEGGGNWSGTFRTLCVRKCDGYYWPISFSARSSRFRQDEQVCRASCGNQDVSLYFHRNPGQQSTDAMSLKGEAYSALPNALLFRNRFVKDCKCQAASMGNDMQVQTPSENPSKSETMTRAPPEPLQNDVEILRTPQHNPVIINPNRMPENATGANGLRGASPEQDEDQ